MNPTHRLDMEKLRGNDEEALAEIARYLLPIVEKIVSKSLTSIDPEDIMQDVLVDVWRNRERLATLETPEQVVRYCLRLARNGLVHRSPESRRVIREQAVEKSWNVSPKLSDRYTEHHELDTLQRAQIEKALTELSKDEQALVLAYFYEGLTVKEIADSFHISEHTVARRLRRSLAKLRQQFLEPRLFEDL